MPYEFYKDEPDLEPQASSARGGAPPGKWTGAGVLDPPFPPRSPSGPVPADLVFRVSRILSGLLLAGLVAAILFFLFGRH